MLTVEQVKNLDSKVHKALELIESQKIENSMLKAKLDEYKQRVDQLESVVDGFKLEQLEIEEGIKDVLTQLDQLEDQITDPSPSIAATPEVAAPQQAAIESSAKPFTEQSSSEQTVEVQPVTAPPVAEQTVKVQPAEVPPVAEPPQKSEEVSADSSVQAPELEIF